MPDDIQKALQRGPHQSAALYVDFVCEEMVDFVNKKFWVVLPTSVASWFPGLHLSPLGVVPQHGRWPRLICDYTFHGVNQETASLAPPEAMQFGHTLR